MTIDPTVAAESDPAIGLSAGEIVAARERHGGNELTVVQPPSVWQLVVDALGDPMLRVLLACAGLSLIVGATHGAWTDGIAIALAVVVVTLVGVYNQRRAQRDYAALDQVASRQGVRVVRGGAIVLVDATALVVGDVIEMASGDVVPADAVLRTGLGLLAGEAHITGEPETSKEVGETIYSGSRVLDGAGRAIVSAVGDATVFGAARLDVVETDKTTPLEQRLDALAKRIGALGTIAAVATFAALMVSGLVGGDAPAVALDGDFIEFVLGALTIAVTIVVVAVPEGLPLAVTLSLAYTTRQMANDRALVRELSACETMGSATIVCSDKTGTLTTGTMTLAGLVLADRRYAPDQLGELARIAPAVFDCVVSALIVNSTTDLLERDGQEIVVGNQTEGAILRTFRDHGVDHVHRRAAAVVFGRTEFNSARKYMSTSVRNGSETTLLVKGAPEVLLGASTTQLLENGERTISAVARRALLAEMRADAARGHRLLAIAYRSLTAEVEHPEELSELVFVGFVLMSDPLRAEVAAAVAHCRSAGVRVMMITGDIAETAAEIARLSGISNGSVELLDGPSLRAMDDDALIQRLRTTSVLARTLPSDKRRVVELLQRDGEVVAVTGDGVNDAPALALADVGFSMGSGAQVAREASDIVIVDDNFASVVRAIRWGRSVFENIRKFLQFQLTVNVVALTVAFVAALAGKGTPLSAVQLLWVNLIMDSLAALALALEPPTDLLFAQAPHGRSEPLISRAMWWNTLGVGLYMTAVLFVVLFTDVIVDPAGLDVAYRSSFLFNAFVFMQIANEFNCRSTRFERSPWTGVLRSPVFLAIVVLIAVTQVLIMFLGGAVFDVTRLRASDWLRCLTLTGTVPLVGGLVRRLGRWFEPRRISVLPGAT